MAIYEMCASGLEYLALATQLLQRVRLADPEAGVWEAADLQWWWRTPRLSDAIDQLFWIDDEGPVAGLVLTDWHRAWGCDPIIVPGVSAVSLPTVWARAVEAIDSLGLEAVEVLARDDDFELLDLLAGAGYAVFWFDPVTEVGMVEPMRVEDAYQRRGLARAMLTTGLARLVKRGARRLKVGYATDVARGLNVGAGFQVTSTPPHTVGDGLRWTDDRSACSISA